MNSCYFAMLKCCRRIEFRVCSVYLDCKGTCVNNLIMLDYRPVALNVVIAYKSNWAWCVFGHFRSIIGSSSIVEMTMKGPYLYWMMEFGIFYAICVFLFLVFYPFVLSY